MLNFVVNNNNVAPSPKRPNYEGVRVLDVLRARMRAAFFRLLRKVADTDDAKSIQWSGLHGLLPYRTELRDAGASAGESSPYPDLPRAGNDIRACQRDDVIIITARFRSGSTLLWNLFRNINGCTAYYEPFNERRWFDPAARGNHTDPSHHRVDDYWREYQGFADLGRHYREAWIRHALFQSADYWAPEMKRYVEILIERAAGRPVLQFNRIDFRLPWFRRTFPNAKVIHLYRHPRDQWLSSLTNPLPFPIDGSMARFGAYDHYYLQTWASDLKYHFPFLVEEQRAHPYRTFYLIWKLSYLFGKRHGHLSISYEELVREPTKSLDKLFRRLGIDGADVESLARIAEPSRTGRWRNYANDNWFRAHEIHCETVLADFYGPSTQ